MTNLWNGPISTDASYQTAVLEQYKIYVEMADRVSARRALANTFFITLNTGVFTVFGVLWKDKPEGTPWLLAFPLLAVLGQCAAWFYILRSYRQLNTAKYKVIGELEQRLPASPYWRAEWTELGEGKARSEYWPLSHVEQWVPVLFATIYLFGFVAAVAS